MPLKILFDFQIFCRQAVGGISRYFSSLIAELEMDETVSIQVSAPIHVNSYLRSIQSGIVDGVYVPRLPHSARLLTTLNNVALALRRTSATADVVHHTYYNEGCARREAQPLVVTVHDLIHETRPSEFSRYDNIIRHKRAAVKLASKVICVSNFTKASLVEKYDLPEEKVTVIHLGSTFNENTQSLHANPNGRPFLLYVGKRSGYKNFGTLLEAYSASRHLINDFDLVCFGGGPLQRDEAKKIALLDIPKGRVKCASGNDMMLATYYRHATALVFPSLHEGFGLPVLEAMALGCPVISSNATSLPEVGGDAAQYFDPEDVEAIENAISSTVYHRDRLMKLRAMGGQQATLFSWQRCASETVAIYREAAERAGD